MSIEERAFILQRVSEVCVCGGGGGGGVNGQVRCPLGQIILYPQVSQPSVRKRVVSSYTRPTVQRTPHLELHKIRPGVSL